MGTMFNVACSVNMKRYNL